MGYPLSYNGFLNRFSNRENSVILSDKTIKRMLKSGELGIDPLDPEQIEPASVDLRLGDTFLTPKATSGIYSMSEAPSYEAVTADEFIIPTHGFVLATTREVIRLPDNLTAFVEGRSSVGRLGLFIQNAGWVDPGFEGAITLELYNANAAPMRIEAGRRICQLVMAMADGVVDNPYRGKYQGQRVTTGSRIHMDSEVG
ncbi:MAG: dCTP deaminase [Candidatus Hydrogenedentota bacterium]|nr:MAG: dCTP deaminase [Candidatus Hydrogenedentota bacterium]